MPNIRTIVSIIASVIVNTYWMFRSKRARTAAHMLHDAIRSATALDTDMKQGWCLLYRADRNPDGAGGEYTFSPKTFASYQDALDYAGTISQSRCPIVIEAGKVQLVLGALNLPVES